MPTTSQNTETPDNKLECVNQGRPVYFSYARNSAKQPGWEHISDCVDAILKELEAQNIEYRLDKRDIGAGDRISDFEKEIGWNSEVVVLVFSDKYFRSMHCMYEFVQIKKALKKYPNKRLLCIKSGDFNLSDSNYVYELEHYWGDVKQEYEEIERHKSREHSGVEKAAFENGFYFDDILGLYPFFSAMNYSYANTSDWTGFVDGIRKYYIDTPKSLFADERKRKSIFRNLKFFGLGIATLAVIVGLLLFKLMSNVPIEEEGFAVSFPEYSSNTYFNDGLAFIKAIRIEDERTVIDFRAVNTTDDTLRAVPAAHSPSLHIVAEGNKYDLVKAYSIPKWVNNLQSGEYEDVPEFFPGGKGTRVEFSLEFAPIPSSAKTIDFVDQDGLGIFGLKLQRQTLKDGLMIPLYDSTKAFAIFNIEFNTDQTVFFCRYHNLADSECKLSASLSDCYVIADGAKINLTNASGIPLSPNSIDLIGNARADFALFFPPIDYRSQNIELIFNGQICVRDIKM